MDVPRVARILRIVIGCISCIILLAIMYAVIFAGEPWNPTISLYVTVTMGAIFSAYFFSDAHILILTEFTVAFLLIIGLPLIWLVQTIFPRISSSYTPLIWLVSLALGIFTVRDSYRRHKAVSAPDEETSTRVLKK